MALPDAGSNGRHPVHSPAAPNPIGPYSQAIRAGNLLFVSGQIGIDPATGALVSGGIEAETRRVLDHLGAILTAAGSGFASVVRTTVYLSDLSEFDAMNAVYATVFPHPAPARSTVQAARLPRDARVEIDLIAAL